MKKRKRGFVGLLILTLVCGLLGGCGIENPDTRKSIFEGDKDALRVFVRPNSNYRAALEEQFPDINFDFYHYGGLNTSMTMHQLLLEDDLGDICFSSLQVMDEVAEEHLLNLAGYSFCGRYEPSMLSQFDVDGKIYQLPGYVTMRNIVYNKKMFHEHGWKEPKNFDELVALCAQIREETEDITPIVMGGAAEGYYFTTMTSYAQAEFLYTPEGQEWVRDYQKGRARAKDGFGAGIDMVQELVDAGAFDYDKNLGLWDMGLFEQRMLTEEAAMMFAWGGQNQVAYAMSEDKEDRFGVMPFRNRDGMAFIGTNIPFYIGISKTLGEPGNEKKLEQALRVVDWIATAEGIEALSEETFCAIFPLKNCENNNVYEKYQTFWNENLDSVKAPMLYSGYEDIIVPAAERIIEAVKGETKLYSLPAYIDSVHQSYLKGGMEAIEVGSFDADFTHCETAKMIANMINSGNDADITMVSEGDYRNGVLNPDSVYGRFLKGPVMEDLLTCCSPGDGVVNPVVKMTLTGKEIEELLIKGKHVILPDDGGKSHATESDEHALASADFEYHYAGIDIKWKNGEIETATLKNGMPLELDKTYTVSFAPGDYTDELAERGKVTDLSYTVKDIMKKYMKANSPISPIPAER